jgi:hypothetical protein
MMGPRDFSLKAIVQGNVKNGHGLKGSSDRTNPLSTTNSDYSPPD